MLRSVSENARILVGLTALGVGLALAGTSVASATPNAGAGHRAGHGLRVRPVLDGKKLRHKFVAKGKSHSEALADPDDITVLGHHLYVAFQNGVGSQGEPSSDGNTDSTVVEFTAGGHVVRQWDIKGKCDGLTADPAPGLVIATVNEDAHSSMYTITPGAAAAAQVQHYHYNRLLPHMGGTDAISIVHGRVYVSASAPGTTGKPAPQPDYPAVYRVAFRLSTHTAFVSFVFTDEATAFVANAGPGHGQKVRLGLTDPDSNEVVPSFAPRFAGAFMVTSQADKEQIFLQSPNSNRFRISVLRLSQSVDDTAWVRGRAGLLFGSDDTSDTVDMVSGQFPVHGVLVAVTPCDAGNAPATCPGPGFPANYLGSLDPATGHISRVHLTGPASAFQPKGMVFVTPGPSAPVG